jgi:hypothetical protein
VLTFESFLGFLLTQPDEKDTADVKRQKFKLALKVAAGGEQDISIPEAKLLIDLAGKYASPIVFGRIEELLEADPAPSEG